MLEKNTNLKKVFKNSTPQIVFKRGETIANKLIRAKFTSKKQADNALTAEDQPFVNILAELNTENPHSVNKCEQRLCLCCDKINICTAFTSSMTKDEFYIAETMDCNTKNVIYLITCKKCNKQNEGQTERRLKDRLNAHRTNIKNKSKTAVSIHFNEPAHSYTDLSIAPIETIQDQSRRLIREKFRIKELKTKYPDGLNFYPIEYTIKNHQI